MSTFSELSLLPSLVASLDEQGITRPTEIQRETIPALLAGESVLGVSQTGSGKTLAYVLPLLHRIKSLELDGDRVTAAGRPRGLVVVPGRELGEQVGRVFKGLTHTTRLRVRLAVGGTAKRVSRRSVGGPFEILVASPGRLLHLVDRGELSLEDVRTVVFDEADQVVDPGFLPVARQILGSCTQQAQTMLFSATLPGSLKEVIDALLPEPPLLVRTASSGQLVAELQVENRTVVDGERAPLLRTILAEDPDAGTLLFANTREQCDRIATWLEEFGVAFVLYRGEMDRIERRRNLASFRNAEVNVLVTTDLGGRGLDIARVDRVINVHLPREVANYVHRAGRTARAGRTGRVINMVTERDRPIMDAAAALRG